MIKEKMSEMYTNWYDNKNNSYQNITNMLIYKNKS